MGHELYGCMPIFYYRQMLVEHTMTVFDWIKIARTLPIAGTELHHRILPGSSPRDLEPLRAALADAGLRVSQVTTTPDFTHPDADVRAAQLSETIGALEAAANIGATCLRVTAGQRYPGVGRADGVGWVVDNFRRLLDRAAGHNVLIAYENHNTAFFAAAPDFSQRADVFLEIVGKMRGEGLRINYDTGNHVVIGEDPLTVLAEVADLVIHTHCSDRVRPLDNTHAAAGEGIVDFPRIFRTLHGAGFHGWLSVEYNGADGLEGLRRALAFVRETWEAISGGTGRP
jgi:sugar phosphate isomerase/epimerase